MTLSPQRAGLLLLGGLSASMLCYLLLMYLPRRAECLELREEITRRQNYVVETSAIQQSIAEGQQRLAQANAFKAERAEKIPDHPQLATFYSQLCAQATAAGARVVRFEPGDVEQLAPLARTPLRLEVAGKFDQIAAVLHHLDATAGAVALSNMHLSTAREGEEGVLHAELDLVIFSDNFGSND